MRGKGHSQAPPRGGWRQPARRDKGRHCQKKTAGNVSYCGGPASAARSSPLLLPGAVVNHPVVAQLKDEWNVGNAPFSTHTQRHGTVATARAGLVWPDQVAAHRSTASDPSSGWPARRPAWPGALHSYEKKATAYPASRLSASACALTSAWYHLQSRGCIQTAWRQETRPGVRAQQRLPAYDSRFVVELIARHHHHLEGRHLFIPPRTATTALG